LDPLVDAISDERAREVALDVAARAEYARFAVPDNSVLMRLLSLLGDLLDWMAALHDRSIGLWLLIMLGLLALAAALLVHVVWTIRSALRANALAAESASSAGERRNLARDAEALAAAGRHLDAAHVLHLACIQRLVERGVLELRRHDPNATLRQRLAGAPLAPVERGEFLQLLDWLEGRWFRDRATDARDAELFSAWRTLHARLMAGVP
jgi:hypothetical protein